MDTGDVINITSTCQTSTQLTFVITHQQHIYSTKSSTWPQFTCSNSELWRQLQLYLCYAK